MPTLSPRSPAQLQAGPLHAMLGLAPRPPPPPDLHLRGLARLAQRERLEGQLFLPPAPGCRGDQGEQEGCRGHGRSTGSRQSQRDGLPGRQARAPAGGPTARRAAVLLLAAAGALAGVGGWGAGRWGVPALPALALKG